MIANREYCVYKHTNKANGKVYIGITCQNPLNRWLNGHGYTHNARFYNAIVKYGWDNFTHEILYSGLSSEEACEIEKKLIAEYKSTHRDFGYNVGLGGNLLSEESAKKVSDAKKGMRLSNEHKRRLSEVKIGKPWSQARRIAQERSQKSGEDHHRSIPVSRYSLSGEYIDTLPNAKMYDVLLKNENAHKHICSVCRGKRKTAYGYIWIYANEAKEHQ